MLTVANLGGLYAFDTLTATYVQSLSITVLLRLPCHASRGNAHIHPGCRK
jgi:hypothetical protein